MKYCFTPNDFIYPEIVCRKRFYKIWFLEIFKTVFITPPKTWTLHFHLFFQIFYENVKRMFLNVVDFSLDERFAKYYHFSSHYLKIVVNKYYQSLPKFSQFGQNVSDIFWICLSHIVLEKARASLISSFWSCDPDFW